MIGMKLYPAIAAETDSEVLGVCFLIQEEVLDDMSLVAKAQDEILVTITGVELHDVPHNREAPDWDHRFGYMFRNITYACAVTTAQNNNFHSRLNKEQLSILDILRNSELFAILMNLFCVFARHA